MVMCSPAFFAVKMQCIMFCHYCGKSLLLFFAAVIFCYNYLCRNIPAPLAFVICFCYNSCGTVMPHMLLLQTGQECLSHYGKVGVLM